MAAAFAVKGPPRGTCAGLSGQSPNNRRFCAPPIPLPSMGSDRRRGKLKAQMDTDFIRQLGPAMHIDLLNRERFRYPVLERKKLVDADQGKQRPKALQKRARDFADGLLEYICSENENYKYVISATKENANMLTKEIELVLLAIRNEGLVLPCIWRRANWILLGDVVLSQLEQLDMDVSELISCKNKMDSTLQTTFPSNNTYGSMNSLCKDPRHIHNFVVDFGNLIVGDISRNASNLGLELSSWMELHLLMTNDKVIESASLMQKRMLDLDNLTATRSPYSIYNPIEDSSSRFLAVYRNVSGTLKAAKEFAKRASFNHEKARNFLAPRGNFGASQLTEFHATKDLAGQRRDQEGSATEKQNFKCHSDDTMRKLLDWSRRLQPEQN